MTSRDRLRRPTHPPPLPAITAAVLLGASVAAGSDSGEPIHRRPPPPPTANDIPMTPAAFVFAGLACVLVCVLVGQGMYYRRAAATVAAGIQQYAQGAAKGMRGLPFSTAVAGASGLAVLSATVVVYALSRVAAYSAADDTAACAIDIAVDAHASAVASAVGHAAAQQRVSLAHASAALLGVLEQGAAAAAVAAAVYRDADATWTSFAANYNAFVDAAYLTRPWYPAIVTDDHFFADVYMKTAPGSLSSPPLGSDGRAAAVEEHVYVPAAGVNRAVGVAFAPTAALVDPAPYMPWGRRGTEHRLSDTASTLAGWRAAEQGVPFVAYEGGARPPLYTVPWVSLAYTTDVETRHGVHLGRVTVAAAVDVMREAVRGFAASLRSASTPPEVLMVYDRVTKRAVAHSAYNVVPDFVRVADWHATKFSERMAPRLEVLRMTSSPDPVDNAVVHWLDAAMADRGGHNHTHGISGELVPPDYYGDAADTPTGDGGSGTEALRAHVLPTGALVDASPHRRTLFFVGACRYRSNACLSVDEEYGPVMAVERVTGQGVAQIRVDMTLWEASAAGEAGGDRTNGSTTAPTRPAADGSACVSPLRALVGDARNPPCSTHGDPFPTRFTFLTRVKPTRAVADADVTTAFIFEQAPGAASLFSLRADASVFIGDEASGCAIDNPLGVTTATTAAHGERNSTDDGPAVPAGVWTSLAVVSTWNGRSGVCRLYANGTLRATAAYAPGFTNIQGPRVGEWGTTADAATPGDAPERDRPHRHWHVGRGYSGRLTCVQVHARTFTAEEVRAWHADGRTVRVVDAAPWVVSAMVFNGSREAGGVPAASAPTGSETSSRGDHEGVDWVVTLRIPAAAVREYVDTELAATLAALRAAAAPVSDAADRKLLEALFVAFIIAALGAAASSALAAALSRSLAAAAEGSCNKAYLSVATRQGCAPVGVALGGDPGRLASVSARRASITHPPLEPTAPPPPPVLIPEYAEVTSMRAAHAAIADLLELYQPFIPRAVKVAAAAVGLGGAAGAAGSGVPPPVAALAPPAMHAASLSPARRAGVAVRRGNRRLIMSPRARAPRDKHELVPPPDWVCEMAEIAVAVLGVWDAATLREVCGTHARVAEVMELFADVVYGVARDCGGWMFSMVEDLQTDAGNRQGMPAHTAEGLGVAFPDGHAACVFALRLQQELLDAAWPDVVMAMPPPRVHERSTGAPGDADRASLATTISPTPASDSSWSPRGGANANAPATAAATSSWPASNPALWGGVLCKVAIDIGRVHPSAFACTPSAAVGSGDLGFDGGDAGVKVQRDHGAGGEDVEAATGRAEVVRHTLQGLAVDTALTMAVDAPPGSVMITGEVYEDIMLRELDNPVVILLGKMDLCLQAPLHSSMSMRRVLISGRMLVQESLALRTRHLCRWLGMSDDAVAANVISPQAHPGGGDAGDDEEELESNFSSPMSDFLQQDLITEHGVLGDGDDGAPPAHPSEQQAQEDYVASVYDTIRRVRVEVLCGDVVESVGTCTPTASMVDTPSARSIASPRARPSTTLYSRIERQVAPKLNFHPRVSVSKTTFRLGAACGGGVPDAPGDFTAAVDKVLWAYRRAAGNVLSALGNSVTGYWRATRSADHIRSAVLYVGTLTEIMQKSGFDGRVHTGVASGDAHIGNVGQGGERFHTVTGSVVALSGLLCESCESLRAAALYTSLDAYEGDRNPYNMHRMLYQRTRRALRPVDEWNLKRGPDTSPLRLLILEIHPKGLGFTPNPAPDAEVSPGVSPVTNAWSHQRGGASGSGSQPRHPPVHTWLPWSRKYWGAFELRDFETLAVAGKHDPIVGRAVRLFRYKHDAYSGLRPPLLMSAL